MVGIHLLLTYVALFLCNYIQAYIYDEYKNWKSIFYILSEAAMICGISYSLLIYFYQPPHKIELTDNE